MGESRRRRAADFGKGPVPVDARLTVTRHAPRFGKRRVEFALGGFTEREAYDAICAIKRTFEARRGFLETPQEDKIAAAAASAPDAEPEQGGANGPL